MHPMVRILACAGLMIAGLSAAAAAAETKKPAAPNTGIAALDQADLTATGKDIRIDDPVAGEGYWTLYVPNDYDAKRKWPVIFNFHYKTGHPNAGPFDALTGTKGYIIVGLGYFDHAGMGNNPEVKQTLAVLKHVHDALAKRLSVDDRLLFIGGVSQGGFRGSVYFESSPEAWAGVILLDAGREPGFSIMPNANPNYAGKPVYIGDGENDDVLPSATQAEDFYKQHGADVTFETYKGMGHSVDMNSKTLRQWLLDHGPMVYVKLTFTQAESLEKAGKKGKAYTEYQQVVNMPDAGDFGDKAKARCDALEASAGKQTDTAEANISGGKRSVGMQELLEISREYAGSPIGDKAKSRIAELRGAPAPATAPSAQAKADSADVDKSADAAEARALGQEKSGDYAAAIASYKAYIAAFPSSHRIAEVTAHLQELQNDPKVKASLASNKADADCKRWMNLADNYLSAGDADQAKTYLQKIIDTYPNTTWADSAKQKLQGMQ